MMDNNISATIAALYSKLANNGPHCLSEYLQKLPILDTLCNNPNEKMLINQIYQVQQLLKGKKPDFMRLPDPLQMNEPQPNAEPFLNYPYMQNQSFGNHQTNQSFPSNMNPVNPVDSISGMLKAREMNLQPNINMNNPVNDGYQSFKMKQSHHSQNFNQTHQETTNSQTINNHSHRSGGSSRKNSDSQYPNGGLVSSLIEGFVIAGFNVWGEKRICLPHLLRFVLNDVDIEQIGLACSKLKITCSKCTPAQLRTLHTEKVLPRDVQVCGLMRKSDAERLVKYLKSQRTPINENSDLQMTDSRMICIDSDDDSEDDSDEACTFWSNDENSALSKSFENVSSSDEMVDVVSEKRALNKKEIPSRLEVLHECFGKQRGYLLPDLYKTPNSPCIECKTCKKLFNPMQFVGHTHGLSEVDMNHWGFDSTNWRCYLRTYRNSSKDTNVAIHKNRSKILEDFKVKFLKPINLPSKLLNALKKCKDESGHGENMKSEKHAPEQVKDKNPALITRVLPNLTLRRIWAPNDGQIYISSPEKINEKSIPSNLQHGTPLLEKSNRVWNLEYAASFGKSFVPNVSLKVCPENCRIPFNKTRCYTKPENVDSKESPWYSGSESLASSSNSLNRSRNNSGSNRKSRKSTSPGSKLKLDHLQRQRTRSLSQSKLTISTENTERHEGLRKCRSLCFFDTNLDSDDFKLSPHSLPNSDENHNTMISFSNQTNALLINNNKTENPISNSSTIKFQKAMNAAFQAQRIAKSYKSSLLSDDEFEFENCENDKKICKISDSIFKSQHHSLSSHMLSYEAFWSQINIFINQFSSQCCGHVNKLVTDLSLTDSASISPVLKSILECKYRLQENIFDMQKTYLSQVQRLCIENNALREALDHSQKSYSQHDPVLALSSYSRGSQEKSNSTREFEADSSGIQQIFSQENSPCGNTGITNSTSSPASTDDNSHLKVQVMGSYDCLMPPHKKRYKMSNDVTSF